MTVLNDDRDRAGRGGVAPASLATPVTAAGVGSAGDARIREARERADRYLAELIEEVGEPSPEEVAEAEAWADRIERALKKARTA